MKKTVGVVIAIGASFVLCGPVFAGETTGNGEPTKGGDKAHSACVFSGQDQSDEFEDNGPNGEFDDDWATARPGHSQVLVQSYGSYVRAGAKAFVPSPGVACNGSGGGG
ncbi:MAG TPA: hypothetical protein VL916_00850 [Ilumatobacteraceae bacterium]|nr:hypothetical protein [Ilumatobacteraceae bacterium]